MVSERAIKTYNILKKRKEAKKRKEMVARLDTNQYLFDKLYRIKKMKHLPS
jgi:hypothetical protein